MAETREQNKKSGGIFERGYRFLRNLNIGALVIEGSFGAVVPGMAAALGGLVVASTVGAVGFDALYQSSRHRGHR